MIEVSRAVMDTFGSLKADLEKQGEKLDDFDLIVASTALHLSYTLVTNNVRHFRCIPGLPVENWAKQGVSGLPAGSSARPSPVAPGRPAPRPL